MNNSFEGVLEHLRSISDTKVQQGRGFERLMKQYFRVDPIYADRFSNVSLWSEWAPDNGFDRNDIGIDLVAEDHDGGFCAIQCKFHAPNTRISKGAIDSFISFSARDPFTARILVDTGAEWGPNAKKTIKGLDPICQLIRLKDLAEQPIDWPDLVRGQPEDLQQQERYQLRPHQKEALKDVHEGFKDNDRGKLIMACGTGKTFTALRVAETIAKKGGRVLYLVPSISLLQQSMREWAEQQDKEKTPLRYIGICSDKRAGQTDEDVSIEELEIPVSTDPVAIGKALRQKSPDAMTVVFCTYHSLTLVEQAQEKGAPKFDLILCDEAHRTTGVERPGEKTSPFVLVHDAERIRANKRLYMTATPRLYTEGARNKAANHGVDVFSMDDKHTYGPEFHRLPFSLAVEKNLLSDYKVVIFAMSENHVDKTLQAHLAAANDGQINITDTAKIIGCWRALQNPENLPVGDSNIKPLSRAISFTSTIRSSKLIAEHWGGIVERASELLPENERDTALKCETQHVDGKHHALDRKERIEWLKEPAEGTCRILSNARCLSEGIDVPALDAVIFMTERKSIVDIVQAVGRTMRKVEDKDYGYIVLPIAIPAGQENPDKVLDNSEEFQTLWNVLRALRSHDDRLDAEINKMDLNRQPPSRIIIHGGENSEGESLSLGEFAFPPLDLPPEAIYAKIVDRCGDRKYWESWAKDVADIFSRLVTRITNLLEKPDNRTLKEWFEAFHGELKASINHSITPQNAIDMMAQHILTQPVFDSLFENYNFAKNNPVARSLDALRKDFGEFGLENEIRDLEEFYESVRQRAQGLDNSEARQRVLMELYEKFFSTAVKKDAERLGIVYTPVEIVDFILHSAEHVVQNEFNRSLSDKDTHVLDPFTGTGIFLARLLQSNLISDADLGRKYRKELHANELVLLAYYIATVHIEEAFHGRVRDASTHEPFNGIVLTDTFNLYTDREGFPKKWLPDNSERAERQQKLPIQVIVGNPPWSAKQQSVADNNPNVDYPELEQRVAETYATRSRTTTKHSLYDTYKMAIRWASDRIGDQGVLAFVTNGSWIESRVDAGVRACLAEEFSSIYVLNIRGNARTSGDLRRSEGGNAFGGGSRAPVAIMVLIKNPNAKHNGCRILYRDIGDYLSREDKLEMLRDWGSISAVENWKEIRPDRHHDWINKRDEAFQELYPMGSKSAKSGETDNAIFQLFCLGYQTGKDACLYNFSREACLENAQLASNDYLDALRVTEEHAHYQIEDIIHKHSVHLPWDATLKSNLKQKKTLTFSPKNIARVQYRPFVKQHCYVEYLLASRKYQQDRIFPNPDADNIVICVSGTGSNTPFSALAVGILPDLNLIQTGQCFPRYRYEKPQSGQLRTLSTMELPSGRIDNISPTALWSFRAHYNDKSITDDAIFAYTYAVLHAPAYRDRFANDLAKELPRIPFAPDFHAFAQAGQRLIDLHLGYETAEEYPLEVGFEGSGKPEPQHYRIGKRAMRFKDKDDKSVLIINKYLHLAGIPAAAHEYQVNGRTPLEWFMDRYKITIDTRSCILNDPNGWFDEPEDLITSFKQIVHVSVETVAIVQGLPDPFPIP